MEHLAGACEIVNAMKGHFQKAHCFQISYRFEAEWSPSQQNLSVKQPYQTNEKFVQQFHFNLIFIIMLHDLNSFFKTILPYQQTSNHLQMFDCKVTH